MITKRKKAATISLAFLVFAVLFASARMAPAADRPNILYLLADDLGYGDVKYLNPDGKIPTPNLDRLASSGMVFTDCHSSSSVCSPTRYGIMTGRYNWRSRLQSGVLGGYSQHLIEDGRLTVAALLRQEGYQTAAFGKWHLGMDWPLKSGGIAKDYKEQWQVDYSKPIQHGPNSAGFDYYFGISASLDMPPFIFIENDHSQGIPTVDKKWIRSGPAHQDFEALDVLPTLTKRVVDYLGQHSKGNGGDRAKPFFVYMPLNSPHTPILPTVPWQGKSGLNPYGDFVMQTDWSVGQVLDALDRNGLTENTLVFFASDNGCSPSANFPELLAKGHNPSFVYRGHKADIWDGGHRIPFMTRWPGHIKPGSKTDQLACLVDFMATCADVLGVKLPANAAEDSVSLLPAMLGKAGSQPLHEAVVHHSIEGRFSIRQANWKLEFCPGSGGWSDPKDPAAVKQGLPERQLYDLTEDIGETKNVQAQHPEIVARLTKLLEKYVADGRSTPGPIQENTVTPDIFKLNKDKAAGKKNAKAIKGEKE